VAADRARHSALLEGSARHGFAMDWVNYIPGDGFYPASNHATGNKDSDLPGGSYDAIRVYLWAGMMDSGGTMRAQVLSDIPAMSVYLADHDAPPEKVSDQGILWRKMGRLDSRPRCCRICEPSPTFNAKARSNGAHEQNARPVHGIVRKGLGLLRSESCPVFHRFYR
jgi:hypothetical protein